jgi:predicted permease
LGGALGLLFAIWGTNLLTAMLAAGPLATGVEDTSINLQLRLDGRLIACVMALCLLTSILFSLAPAFRLSKLPLTAALRGAGGRAGGRFALGKVLVVAQVALALTLLLGAGLLVRTLRNLQAQDTGFDRENLLLAWIAPVRTGRTIPELADFSEAVRTRLSSLPGVSSIGIANGGVLDGSVGGTKSEYVKVEGRAAKPGLQLRLFTTTPGFFATVAAPLLAGRDFTERDSDAAPQVAIINETMARFFFGNENPVGKRFAGRGEEGYPTEIIGVAKDMKAGTPRDQRGVWYVPHRQGARFLRLNWCVTVRTTGAPAVLAASVQQALRELDPRLPILRVTTLNGQLEHVLAQERLIATLASFFGVLAALLSCLGLYGVVSYTVAQRTSEIGIRLALGATPVHVLRKVLQESLGLALVGIALGVPLALALMRLLAARLYGVNPADPFTLTLAVGLMLSIAALAAFAPARRASRVDPMIALRHE